MNKIGWYRVRGDGMKPDQKKLHKLCSICLRILTKKTDVRICHGCGCSLCGLHAFSYVDGNNGSITKHSPEYCHKCYVEKYIG